MAELAPPQGGAEADLRFDPEDEIGLLLRDLGTSRPGLSPRVAARRLEQHGPNEIRTREQRSRVRDLAGQFTQPLALLLWVAAALAVVGGIVPLAIANAKASLGWGQAVALGILLQRAGLPRGGGSATPHTASHTSSSPSCSR